MLWNWLSNWWTYVDELEKIEDLTGIKNCVAVGNATDAMEIIFSYWFAPKF